MDRSRSQHGSWRNAAHSVSALTFDSPLTWQYAVMMTSSPSSRKVRGHESSFPSSAVAVSVTGRLPARVASSRQAVLDSSCRQQRNAEQGTEQLHRALTLPPFHVEATTSSVNGRLPLREASSRRGALDSSFRKQQKTHSHSALVQTFILSENFSPSTHNRPPT